MTVRRKPSKFDCVVVHASGQWVDLLRQTETCIYGDSAPSKYTYIYGSIVRGSGPNDVNYWLTVLPYHHYLPCGIRQPIVKGFKRLAEARSYGLTVLRRAYRRYRKWDAERSRRFKKRMATRLKASKAAAKKRRKKA